MAEFTEEQRFQLAMAHLARADRAADVMRSLLVTAAGASLGFVLLPAAPAAGGQFWSAAFFALAATLVFLSWAVQKWKSIDRFKELLAGNFAGYTRRRISNIVLDLAAALLIAAGLFVEILIRSWPSLKC